MSNVIRNVTKLYDAAETAANNINFKLEYSVPDIAALVKAAYIRGYVDGIDRNKPTQDISTPIRIEGIENKIDIDAETWKSLKEAIIKSVRFQEMYDAGGNIDNAINNIKDWLSKTYTSDSANYLKILIALENLDHWEHIADELSKVIAMSETHDYKLINQASIDAYNELRQLQSKVKLLRSNVEDGWR